MLLPLEEAEKRMIESRFKLDHWIMRGSIEPPETTLQVIAHEIRALADLVDEHENLGGQASELIAGWVLFRARTRMRCH